MKILIIGDADSKWIKDVIQRTLIPFGDQVELLTYKNSINASFYKTNNIVVHCITTHGSALMKLFNGVLNRRVFDNHYDVVHIHFAAIPYLVMLPFAQKTTKRTIVSFWGSDILRSKGRKWIKMFCLNYSDAITLSTKEMERKFHKVYGNLFDKKLFHVSFGSDIIDEMDNTSEKALNTICDKYIIPKDKVIVSIGYNASPVQQHDKVLDSLRALPQRLSKTLHIILRMTYGKMDLDYIQKVKSALGQLGCTYTIFEDYLTNKAIAELTAITDIFINAQISDARSASMCEHLYAGCLVLNPSWIRYSELQNKVYYLEYNDITDIPLILRENMCKKEKNRNWSQLYNNRDYIYSIASWDNVIEDWRKVYKLQD